MARQSSRTGDDRLLYLRAHAQIKQRIRSGVWKPGEKLPSEIELAAKLGMSQGTVRRAINLLADERIVVRQQGRGTVVRELTPEDLNFRFFHLFDRHGKRIMPGSAHVAVSTGKALKVEADRLGLSAGARVVRIDRLRTHGAKPFVIERSVLPEALVPGLAELQEIPNTIYDHLQRAYRITIARAIERLRPVAATAAEGRRLSVRAGTPLLEIDRIAKDLSNRTVEWRVSRCRIDEGHYAVVLT